jgi:hypothetical protein
MAVRLPTKAASVFMRFAKGKTPMSMSAGRSESPGTAISDYGGRAVCSKAASTGPGLRKSRCLGNC